MSSYNKIAQLHLAKANNPVSRLWKSKRNAVIFILLHSVLHLSL